MAITTGERSGLLSFHLQISDLPRFRQTESQLNRRQMLFGEMERPELSIDDLVERDLDKGNLKDRLILPIQQIPIN
jgi:hypothetical protein